MATPKTKQNPATPSVEQVFEPRLYGNYRCTWPNEWGRPCNKFMGAGTGKLERNCPRCKRPCRFENPNEMIP